MTVLDAGVFILASGANRTVAALMRATAGRSRLFVAAHTIAEFYRGDRAGAASANLLRMWRVEYAQVSEEDGRLAGRLVAQFDAELVMDALLVAVASRLRAQEIFTTDPDDLTKLCDALPASNHRNIAIVDIQ